MTLSYLAGAYLCGVILGHWLWLAGWFPCATPSTLWLGPAAGLGLLPWMASAQNQAHLPPMTWPTSAGFRPPTQGIAPRLLAALAICLLMGVLRYAGHPDTPCWQAGDLAYYNMPAELGFRPAGPTVTLLGYVSSYPLKQDRQQRLHIRVYTLMMDGEERSVTGQVRATVSAQHPFSFGQPVRATGMLTEPPIFDDFDYRAYLMRKGVQSVLQQPRVERVTGPRQGGRLVGALYDLRQRGEGLLNRLLPEPYAALANGMLLGIESGIPQALYEQFNLTGTSHTIVISGSNVAIIASLVMAFMARLLGQRRSLLPTLMGIGLYAILVGGDAAVLRAAVMGGLYVVASVLKRRNTGLVSLGAACWVMTLINPLMFWDVGFQLSSAATGGLILFTPPLLDRFERLWARPAPESQGLTPAKLVTGQLRGFLEEGLVVTLAANLTTLPLVVYYFGRLSVVSLLSNLLILPVQPFIMIWGGAGLLVGLFGLPVLAQVILWIPWLCLAWTVTMVTWTAQLPGASMLVTHFGMGSLLATYLALGLVRWPPWQFLLNQVERLNQLSLRALLPPPGVVMGGVATGVVMIWLVAAGQPDGYLHLYFLNIGQGDGIFIQTPSGRQILIDGGLSPQLLLSELGAVMPFWDRTLDLVIPTHPDGDHMGSQHVLPQKFHIDRMLDTAHGQQSPDSRLWRAAMAEAQIPVSIQGAGGWVDLGDGVVLWVLWPGGDAGDEEDDNENSLVFKLVYGDFSALLTGDAGIASETALLRQADLLSATVLKAGHHGSRSSTSPPFLAAVAPELVVIQVGENRYGHPHPEVLERLTGITTLRNDLDGRVHLYTDGQSLALSTQ